MNETLALLISGASILGSIGIVFSFKGKYTKLTKDFEERQKKFEEVEVLSNSSEEKINSLETKVKDLEKQKNEILAKTILDQEKIKKLSQDALDGNKYQNDITILQEINKKLNQDVSELQKKEIIAIDSLNSLKEEINKLTLSKNEKDNNEVKKILMVDDSIVIRTKMKKLLIDSGYDVTLANDGADALNILPTKQFDLIITDLEMPNVNGYEFMLKANENPFTKKIPVIVITGHEEIHINVSQSENLAGVYKKPWKEPELLQKIKFLCK